MPYIIPNTTAIPQTVSAAQIIVNGTACAWPSDKIIEGVKVIHHIECSIGCENTGAVPAELKFTFQRDIGSGWENVAGEVACYTVSVGEDARRKVNFKVPYYNGISGFVPHYRLAAECPAGEVTLHRAEGRDAVPTVTGKQEHEFEGEEPSPPEIVTFIGLAAIDSPVSTGDIFAGVNINTHFIPIEGNRFVWACHDGNTTQTVVGVCDQGGAVSLGALSENTFGGLPLSGNTMGVMSIGNNKFARYTSYSFAVFDCASSGLTATLVAENQGCATVPPVGTRECCVYSSGSIYMIPGYPFNLHRYNVDNITDVIGNESISSDSVFGPNRTIYYESELATEFYAAMRGAAIPGGGVMWVARTSDGDETSNPGMDYIITNGLSVDLYRCQDADGYPTAMAIGSDGVFVVLYRTIGSRIMRLRTGKITNFVPVFGGYIDLYNGAEFTNLAPASMCSGSTGEFALVVQDWINTGRQHYFVISADGTAISCDNRGAKYFSHTIGGPPVGIIPVDSGMYVVGNYGYNSFDFGSVDSRFTTALELVTTQVNVDLTDSTPVQVTCALDEWKFFRILSGIDDTQLVIDLTGLTGDLNLYVLKDAPPRYTNDGYSENSGTESEQITIANAGATEWWIGVFGYQAGSGTLTATLT